MAAMVIAWYLNVWESKWKKRNLKMSPGLPQMTGDMECIEYLQELLRQFFYHKKFLYM